MRINSQAIEKLGQQYLDIGAEANFPSGRLTPIVNELLTLLLNERFKFFVGVITKMDSIDTIRVYWHN